MLVAAQKTSGARFRNRVLHIKNKSRRVRVQCPNAENEAFAIHDSDHAIGGNFRGTRRGLRDDLLHIGNIGQLRRDTSRQQQRTKREESRGIIFKSGLHSGISRLSLLVAITYKAVRQMRKFLPPSKSSIPLLF